jgi:hypothetical protein
MSYKIKCPKCGDLWEVTSSRTTGSCRCGAKIDYEKGECSHGKKKGQCNDPKCDFYK